MISFLKQIRVIIRHKYLFCEVDECFDTCITGQRFHYVLVQITFIIFFTQVDKILNEKVALYFTPKGLWKLSNWQTVQ